MEKPKRKGRVISVDFTGTEGQNNVPNADYKVKVADITEEEGDKGPYLQFKLEILEGKFKGKKLFHICSLTKQSLWNLRATLEALGQKVPESVMNVDPEKLKNLAMGVSTEIEVYKGKKRSKVVDVFSLSDAAPESEPEEEEPEEEEPEEEEPEEEKPEEGDDELGLKKMSLGDLIKLAKENEITIKPEDKLNKGKIIKSITNYLNG